MITVMVMKFIQNRGRDLFLLLMLQDLFEPLSIFVSEGCLHLDVIIRPQQLKHAKKLLLFLKVTAAQQRIILKKAK